jgi:hypothetical protein
VLPVRIHTALCRHAEEQAQFPPRNIRRLKVPRTRHDTSPWFDTMSGESDAERKAGAHG